MNNIAITIKNILYILLILISTIPGYYLVKYGLHFTDEPYQIMNTMDIHRSPLAPLTSWFGGLLGQLTDYRWLSYRYLAVTLNNLSIIVAGLYMYYRVRSISLTAITCSIAIILSGLSRSYHNLFGWDSFTAFFIVVLIVCMLLFIEHPNFIRLFSVAVVSVLTTLVRIPNIVCFPIIIAVTVFMSSKIYSVQNPGISRKYIISYIFQFAVLLFVIITLLYHSIHIYIYDIKFNSISSHSASSLLGVFIHSFIRYSLSIMAFGMVVIVLSWFRKRMASEETIFWKNHFKILSLFAIVWLYSVVHYLPNVINVPEYDVVWILLALVYLLIAFYLNKSFKKLLSIVVILIFGSICFIGSNNGFVKFPAFLLIPFTTTFLIQNTSQSKIRYFLIIAILPLLITYAQTIPNIAFQDDGFKYSDTMVKEGRASGLYTSSQKASVVEDIQKLNKILTSHRIVVGEGYDRFVYEYILNCPNSYLRHDWTLGAKNLDKQEYVYWLEKRMSEMDDYAIVYIKRENGSSSIVEEFLDKNFKNKSEYNSFIVYLPN
ncbi:MAG: hypothetical protein K2M06_08600 [Muribaculaceae bacterium]|nr:hypothetical protein [Muribaculaceae bacterium]